MYARNEISDIIIGASIEVHKILGPGLLEAVYEAALIKELQLNNLHVLSQVGLPVDYKGITTDVGYRLDLLVENKVAVELKSVEKVNNLHVAQLLTYLKLCNKKLGLLINFNVPKLKDGIKRIVNNLKTIKSLCLSALFVLEYFLYSYMKTEVRYILMVYIILRKS